MFQYVFLPKILALSKDLSNHFCSMFGIAQWFSISLQEHDIISVFFLRDD